MMGEHYDVVIIGAGLSGIIAAQRWLQAHQRDRVILLEKEGEVGGVWSERRSYDTFWTQWTHGTSHFSDMSMPRPPEEDCMYDHYRAKYVTRYLEDYVDHMVHDGRSLRDRIIFNVNVSRADKVDGKWRLKCTLGDDTSKTYTAAKLMVAAGQCSRPQMPSLPGKEHFTGQIVHTKDYGDDFVYDISASSHIAVLGGSKSAIDMVYRSLKAGKQVSWIIRKSGTGPGCFTPIDVYAPGYRNSFEAALTRMMASLQPSIFNPEGWWNWFWHRTCLGIWLVGMIFGGFDGQVRGRARYQREGNDKGFDKLDYEPSIFWSNGGIGTLHHLDFWDMVAETVQVYRGDVTGVGADRVVLDDGSHIKCDTILCATGYVPSIEFFSEDMCLKLGVPHSTESEHPEESARWAKLLLEADDLVVKKFPMLGDPPKHALRPKDRTPYKLYNWMASLSDDSILFMNHIGIGNKLMVAEAQAMWAVAYFGGKITLPGIADCEREIALMTAWSRRRYLSNGEPGNYAAFDSVIYCDRLMMEMDLSAHLRGSLWDFFLVFKPADLGRAWSEYLSRHNST